MAASSARIETITKRQKSGSSLSWRCILNGSTGLLLICLGVHIFSSSIQSARRKQVMLVRTSTKYVKSQPAPSIATRSGPQSKAVYSSSPPESIDSISFCAEKCRYVKEMCTQDKYRDAITLPAPTCLQYSTTTKDDIYWPVRNNEKYTRRNIETNILIDWAAKEARTIRQSYNLPNSACEEVPTEYKSPMMFPEEFEFISKLFTNMQPETYLEWGCGMSTSFYPLLATRTVIAIDGFPPWCEQVGNEPRVKCMRDEDKLHFFCPELVGVDGEPVEMTQPVGKLNMNTADKDVENVMDIYVNSVTVAMDKANVTKLDVALVDGRFRVQCALKLLPYLHSDSVLLMHDFWIRYNFFKDVLLSIMM